MALQIKPGAGSCRCNSSTDLTMRRHVAAPAKAPFSSMASARMAASTVAYMKKILIGLAVILVLIVGLGQG